MGRATGPELQYWAQTKLPKNCHDQLHQLQRNHWAQDKWAIDNRSRVELTTGTGPRVEMGGLWRGEQHSSGEMDGGGTGPSDLWWARGVGGAGVTLKTVFALHDMCHDALSTEG